MRTLTHPEAFYQYLRALLKAGGHSANAAFQIETSGRDDIDPRVIRALKANINKAAIAAATAGDATDAGPLVGYRSFVGEWFASLRSISLLDALLTAVHRQPVYSYGAVTTSAAVGHNILEAVWKPLTKMQFSAEHATPLHAMSLTVVSDELIRNWTSAAESLINMELKMAVSRNCDIPVAQILLNGVTPSASSGDPRTDIATLLAAVPMGQMSRPMLFAAPDVVKALGIAGTPAGATFPDVLIPNGGSISGMDTLSVDVLHAYGTDGDIMLLFDASQCSGDSGDLALDVSNEATLKMADDVDTVGSPAVPAVGSAHPYTLTSLFSNDSTAIRAERWFAFSKLRTAAVAAIKNVAYSIGSP